MFQSSPSRPRNGDLFGNRIFADVLKLRRYPVGLGVGTNAKGRCLYNGTERKILKQTQQRQVRDESDEDQSQGTPGMARSPEK